MALAVKDINLQGWLKGNLDRLIFLAVMVIALIIASQIYNSQKSKTQALKEEIAAQEDRIGLARELEGLGKKISQDAFIYLKPDKPLDSEFFRALASSTGVKAVSVIPEKERGSDFSIVKVFDLELKGPYHKLAKFISLLESQENMLQIESVSLKSVDNLSGPQDLSLSLSAAVTYVKGNE